MGTRNLTMVIHEGQTKVAQYGQWDAGNIQVCSFEHQGIFINICSMYWQRLGDLPYALALRKVCGGNAVALQALCDADVLKVIDDMICIDFLNEQLSEFEDTSKQNSKNARDGWETRRQKQKNATASIPQSDRIANAMPEEKRREEHIYGSGNISIAIRPKYIKDRPIRIFDLRLFFEETKQVADLDLKGWTHFAAFINDNAGRVFNDPDHVYNSFRQFCESYKPPASEPDKYENAAYNRTLWTVEAWEKAYAWQLKDNNDFRKHFGYEELPSSKAMGGNNNGRSGPKGTTGGKT